MYSMEILTLLLTLVALGLFLVCWWESDRAWRLHFPTFLISTLSLSQALIDTGLSGMQLAIVVVLNLMVFLFALVGMIRALNGSGNRRRR